MPALFHMTRGVYESLVAHAERDYPLECCGILLGRAESTDVYAEDVVRGRNIADGDRAFAYQIDWQTLFSSVRRARASNGGQRIVGFYHSHPDGSARPSRRDTEAAWAGQNYVIVSMANGCCTGVTCWQLAVESKSWVNQKIVRY